MFPSLVQPVTEQQITQHAVLEAFQDKRDEVKGVTGDQEEEIDDELTMQTARMEYRCKLTMKWVQDPWKSAVCGHWYEHDAILRSIRQAGGREVKCPYPGCRKRVREEDLVEDKKTRKAAERDAKERAKEHQKTQSMAEEVVDL